MIKLLSMCLELHIIMTLSHEDVISITYLSEWADNLSLWVDNYSLLLSILSVRL